jgi:hypothetical protein
MVSDTPAPTGPAPERGALLLANVLVLGVLAFAWALEQRDPECFYRAVQEDGTVEWVSFWAFCLAGVAAALRQRRQTRRLPWFLGGVALFCFFVAMEEISWGQRLLGFQPPAYFLERNYQQEANLHNVVATDLRMLAFSLVIAGYGIALPLLARVPSLGRLLRRLAVVGPPAGLIPTFAASLLTYELYPWDFAGEVVELTVGLGFLFTAVMRAHEFRGEASRGARRPAAAPVAFFAALALVLGLANDALSRRQRSAEHCRRRGTPRARGAGPRRRRPRPRPPRAPRDPLRRAQAPLQSGGGERRRVPGRRRVHGPSGARPSRAARRLPDRPVEHGLLAPLQVRRRRRPPESLPLQLRTQPAAGLRRVGGRRR